MVARRGLKKMTDSGCPHFHAFYDVIPFLSFVVWQSDLFLPSSTTRSESVWAQKEHAMVLRADQKPDDSVSHSARTAVQEGPPAQHPCPELKD